MEEFCRGSCLTQTSDSHTYERIKPCDCLPIKCPNYVLCRSVAPLKILDANFGLCRICAMTFGKKITVENITDVCCVCLENKFEFLKMNNCNHFFCPDCYNRLHWNNHQIIEERPIVVIELGEINTMKDLDDDENNNENDDENDDENDESSNKCPLCRQKTIPSWKK